MEPLKTVRDYNKDTKDSAMILEMDVLKCPWCNEANDIRPHMLGNLTNLTCPNCEGVIPVKTIVRTEPHRYISTLDLIQDTDKEKQDFVEDLKNSLKAVKNIGETDK